MREVCVLVNCMACCYEFPGLVYYLVVVCLICAADANEFWDNPFSPLPITPHNFINLQSLEFGTKEGAIKQQWLSQPMAMNDGRGEAETEFKARRLTQSSRGMPQVFRYIK